MYVEGLKLARCYIWLWYEFLTKCMRYYGFITFFIKTNSPSTLNRNGRNSKLELYHTSEQLSQHDCPTRFFPTSISVCIWNQLYACFYLKDVMNVSLFKLVNKVWFVKLHRGIIVSLSLILMIKFMCVLNSKL
jgi:hypothetical protein